MDARQVYLNRLSVSMSRVANTTLGDLARAKEKDAAQQAEIAALKFEASWTPTVQPLDDRVWV